MARKKFGRKKKTEKSPEEMDQEKNASSKERTKKNSGKIIYRKGGGSPWFGMFFSVVAVMRQYPRELHGLFCFFKQLFRSTSDILGHDVFILSLPAHFACS